MCFGLKRTGLCFVTCFGACVGVWLGLKGAVLVAIFADNVTYNIGAKEILKPCSFSIDEKKLTVILGPNGSGKTTLMRLLAGELKASAGELKFNERKLESFSKKQLASIRAVLPQQSQVAFPILVEDLLSLSAYPSPRGLKENAAVLAKVSQQFDIKKFMTRNYQSLSGGEKQRVQLARVFAQIPEGYSTGDPRYLFLDEASSALDLHHSLKLMMLLKERVQNAQENTGCVLVMHDLNLALKFADEIILMDHGQLLVKGNAKEVLSPEYLLKVFKVNAQVIEGDVGPSYIETSL